MIEYVVGEFGEGSGAWDVSRSNGWGHHHVLVTYKNHATALRVAKMLSEHIEEEI